MLTRAQCLALDAVWPKRHSCLPYLRALMGMREAASMPARARPAVERSPDSKVDDMIRATFLRGQAHA